MNFLSTGKEFGTKTILCLTEQLIQTKKAIHNKSTLYHSQQDFLTKRTACIEAWAKENYA